VKEMLDHLMPTASKQQRQFIMTSATITNPVKKLMKKINISYETIDMNSAMTVPANSMMKFE
jgi:superfamily II DNA/RNA helicase